MRWCCYLLCRLCTLYTHPEELAAVLDLSGHRVDARVHLHDLLDGGGCLSNFALKGSSGARACVEYTIRECANKIELVGKLGCRRRRHLSEISQHLFLPFQAHRRYH